MYFKIYTVASRNAKKKTAIVSKVNSKGNLGVIGEHVIKLAKVTFRNSSIENYLDKCIKYKSVIIIGYYTTL